MIETELPAPFFFADDPALDFLDSIAAPRDTEIEWIGNGGDFLTWLEQAELVPTNVVKRFRASTPPAQLDEIAAQARQLREWFRKFIAKHAGRPLQPSALARLEPINMLLAADQSFHQIEATGAGSLGWRQERRWDAPQSLLLPIAEAMGDLACRADFSHVKNCEGPSCTMWFHDVTKNHTRRWCDMAVCGNRAKAALHRAKRQSTGAKRGEK